jgi:methyl-accepting chemotaxis protein
MARQGGKTVESSLQKMRAIAASVRATANKVQELGKGSDQIGEIISVIDDIADQTNLLALNAAIEAARAGEQGRGFAVVADEVRKLAERTSKATKEIAQMIQRIQVETRSAVEAMREGTRQVEEGVDSTAEAGKALADIIRTAEQAGQMISQIAGAAAEQSTATDEASANIEKIAQVTRETATGTRQSVHACRELTTLALELQHLAGQFKLRANPACATQAGDNGRGNGAELSVAFPPRRLSGAAPAPKGNKGKRSHQVSEWAEVSQRLSR